MDCLHGNLNSDPVLFDFLGRAFGKLYPGHESEVPEEIFGRNARRARVEHILGDQKRSLGVKEVFDITEFFDPETNSPRTYILLHGFLRNGSHALSGSSMLSLHSEDSESGVRPGYFKGPLGLRAGLDNPLPVIERTIYNLGKVTGVDEGRLPIISSRLIQGFDFFVEEPEGGGDHSWDRQ